MKPIALFLFLSFPLFLCYSQNPDLARQLSLLTTDCKNIRGHAGRIVAEANQTAFNADVARAHLDEIAKFHALMEQQLEGSKKLLQASEMKLVGAEYKSLEKTCSVIGGLVEKLQKEFQKDEADRSTVRDVASSLRAEMSSGYDVHERLKKKLGIQ